MDVTKKLIIRPETVETIFDYYQKDILLVNRRYQRKLVWTIEEKIGFIDSISKNYPVPLLLVAEISYQSNTILEIIDGMQRLNAIISFIEGDFKLNKGYFDLETFATSKYLLDQGKLKQNYPKLEREFCKNIASYQLPLSVSIFKEEKAIDDIFKRINSSGKHLSNQEIRQAGLNSAFGSLVRKISENIRGDVSHSDRLTLNNMKKISINNHQLSYGIDMGGIFWRKHGIVTNSNIRESRDEELVAHLLSAILIEPRPAASSRNLNGFYGLDGNDDTVITSQIRKVGKEQIIKTFESIIDELRKTFESKAGGSFHKILFKKEVKYVSRIFQVFFLAYYDLLVKEQKRIIDYSALANNLEGVGDTYLSQNAELYNQTKYRDQGVEIVKGLIRKSFVDRTQTDPALNNGYMKLENILSSSQTETTSYDFKIGFHRLDSNGDFDSNAFDKILKTLTAIANKGKDSIGYVIVGVADNKEDSERHEKYYATKSSKYKNFYITGVNNEAKKYKNPDEYRSLIENKIKTSNISPSTYKDQILRHIDYFNYKDKAILILRIRTEDEPAKFGDNYYERQGANTVVVPRDKEKNIWKRIL